MNILEIKKLKEINFIKTQIIEGKNLQKFLVINTECGVGKTRGAEEALAELYKIDPSRKSIYVKPQVDDTSYRRINELAGANIAIAIDSIMLNESDFRAKLNQYNVLIITHEKYKQLGKNIKEREKFTKDRTILVIDEEINITDTILYNPGRIDQIGFLMREGAMREAYIEIVQPIKLFIKKQKEQKYNKPKAKDKSSSIDEDKEKFFRFDFTKELKDKLSYLKEVVNRNISNEEIIDRFRGAFIQLNIKKGDNYKMALLKEIYMLEQIFKNVCLYDRKGISTNDKGIFYWKLENNLILDANGDFNFCYKLNTDLFELSNRSKVHDYSDWTVHVSYVNTTISGKKKYVDFSADIGKLLKGIAKPGDKILIITNKAEEAILKKLVQDLKIDGVLINIDHYGNFMGKNEWREYNKIIIPHTYNLPSYAYVWKYLFYDISLSEVFVDTRMGRKNNNNVMKFDDEKLDGVRKSFIAGQKYQAIKRICRDMRGIVDVYILCGDEQIVKTVLDQMPNCKENVIEFSGEKIVTVRKVYSMVNREGETNVNKLIEYVSSLGKGSYKKKIIRERLGIKNSTNFSRVLKDSKVMEFFIDKGILCDNNNIIIP